MAQKSFFSALVLCLSFGAIAQKQFSKGYYIDNQGEKISCYINNTNRITNPESFQYKLDSLSETQEQSLAQVQEFGMKEPKYKRAIVRIDIGKMETEEISAGPKPEWAIDTVFLKVLVEGS